MLRVAVMVAEDRGGFLIHFQVLQLRNSKGVDDLQDTY